MNGPEHYAAAESYLELACNTDEGEHLEGFRLAAAQIHATLALAAATALWPAGSHNVSMSSMNEMTAWQEVCSVSPDEVSS